MTIYRMLASIERDTGLPEDRSTNSLHFASFGDFLGAPALDDLHDAVGDFYEAIAPGLLSSVNANLVTLKTYDLADAKPRTVVKETTRVIAPNAAHSCPEEVAMCLSFQGTKMSGVPQARRRGRIFLGPLQFGVIEMITGRIRVTAAARTTLTGAGNGLLTRSTASADWNWCVYSPTQDATLSLDASATAVTNGWVDDAFDTIRSRGPKASTRTVFGIL